MVAVTVILAAVIGAFVFQMYPNLLPSQSNQPVGFKYDAGASTLTITNNGGIDVSGLMVKPNGYEIKDLVVETPAPIDNAAACSKLQTVGGSIVIDCAIAGSEMTSGKVVTVTGIVGDTNTAVVLASYTIP